MIKKIKFPLEMTKGKQVRTIEELRENFNLEKILEYFIDNRLIIWLDDRYYESESERIKQLSKDDPEIGRKLCNIFDIEYEEDNQLNFAQIQHRKQRIDKLKQFTDDTNIINSINIVAFNQEELAELLDNDEEKIYLCNGEFSIPVSKKNVKYIGVSKPIVHIKSNVKIDLNEKKIVLENIDLDNKSKSNLLHYEKINDCIITNNDYSEVVEYDITDIEFEGEIMENSLYIYDNRKIYYQEDYFGSRNLYIEDKKNKEKQKIEALSSDLCYEDKLIFCREYLFFIRSDSLCRYSFKDDYVIEIDTSVYEATISDERLFYIKSTGGRRGMFSWNGSIIQTNFEGTATKTLLDISHRVMQLKCVGDVLYYSVCKDDVAAFMGMGEKKGCKLRLDKM